MNLKIAMQLMLVHCIAMSSLSCSQDNPPNEILAAVKAGIETEQQFNTVFDFIRSTDEDERWREIPWIPSLWTGLQTADEKQKPLFIWAMNGDPLGCV